MKMLASQRSGLGARAGSSAAAGSCPLRLQQRRSSRRAAVSVRAEASSSSGLDAIALGSFKVLVAGATGGVGRQVVETLVANQVPVRALVRDVNKAKSILPSTGPGGLVELVKGDVFQYASLPAALGDANAIICATGANDPTDPLGPFNVDYQGTANLVALARQRALRKFVLVTSIGADDLINPLNLFWGVLFWKKRGEEELQRSGLDYTIVRPGGLKNSLQAGEQEGAVVMKGPGSYGVPPKGKAGSILRRQVAEVCVAALYEGGATDKVVEIIAEKDAARKDWGELFEGVEM